MVNGEITVDRATLLNAGLFQLVWFGSVLGAGVYQSLSYAVVALVLLVLSLRLHQRQRSDLWLVLIALPAGWLLDTLWIRLGVLDYGDTLTAPTWILLMWIGVALTVNHSLVILRDRPLLGALVVAVFAPVSYLAGQRLGAVDVPDVQRLWMVCLSWGLLFYLMFRLALRLSESTAASVVSE